MHIPSALTLGAVQQGFRDVDALIAALGQTTPYDWKQRRLSNLEDGEADQDAVTVAQLTASIEALRTDLDTAGADAPQAGSRIGVFTARGAPGAHRGQLFFASDRHYVGWVSTGAAWVYVLGTQRGAIASLTASLTTNDAGYLYYATDYARTFRWTGSVWENAPGDTMQGEVRGFTIAPGTGWQLCDGSTVTRSTPTGGTTSVTVPNYATPAYVKFATALTVGPTAASGTSGSTGPETGGPSDTTEVASGSGEDVASGDHTHDVDSHDHGPGTLELRRTELLAYMRL